MTANERAKKELSSAMAANVHLPFITKNKEGAISLEMTITKEEFDRLTADLVERTVVPVENALADAHVEKTDISKVLLVGGSTRIPAVRERVTKLMGKEPSGSLNPDECVALGAAVQVRGHGAKIVGEGAGMRVLLQRRGGGGNGDVLFRTVGV